MRKTAELLSRAEECLNRARQVSSPEDKSQLLTMADTWRLMAEQREKELLRTEHEQR